MSRTKSPSDIAPLNGHRRNGHAVGSRTPPESRIEEQRILGYCLVQPRIPAEISQHLRQSDFSSHDYGRVYGAMCKLSAQHKPPLVTSIVEMLSDGTNDDAVYLGELLDEAMAYGCLDLDVSHNVRLIKEVSNSRKLLHTISQAAADIYDRAELTSVIATLNDSINSLDSPSVKNDFPTLTSGVLDGETYDTDYIIPGILVKNQPCILAGQKKCLKTNTLIDLTLSLASGAKFLNEFLVSGPMRVALMSGESGAGTIQETARRIAKSKPWRNLADYHDAFWCFALPKLGQPTTVKSIVDYVERHKLDVLIIDPAYLAMPIGDSASNLFLVGAMLGDLTKVSELTGVTIILCHHTRKNNLAQYDPPELESIAWAGFSEWARQWILLGRRSPYNPDNGGHHELWLTAGGSAGHSLLRAVDIDEGTRESERGRKWIVEVRKPHEIQRDEQEQKEQAKREREQNQVQANAAKLFEVYKRFPTGETAKVLRCEAGLNPAKFADANAMLIKNGDVEACEIKKNKRPEVAFRLVAASENRSVEHGGTRWNTVDQSHPRHSVSAGGPSVSPFRGDAVWSTDADGVESTDFEDEIGPGESVEVAF